MKIISSVIAVLVLLTSSISCLAVDGLQVSVQKTNAILHWQSTNTETYLIQYRSNLNAAYAWQTLADFYSADAASNVTYFIHSNSVTYPPFQMGATNGNPSPTNTVSGGTNNFFTTAGFYRVVRDGAYIVGLTNGAVLSGIVTLPIELGYMSGTLDFVSITENNNSLGDSIQSKPNLSPLGMKLDTTRLANGVHNIYAYASWSDTNGGRWEADSPVVSITTSNEITFENWMPYYGEINNYVLFRATSAHPSTDWIVKVYTDNNTYLGYFNGHTDDGEIGFYWDYSGTPYTNDPSFQFEVSTEYIDPLAPRTFNRKDPWTAAGKWAIAIQHAWDTSIDSDQYYSELDSFVGVAGSLGGIAPPPDSSTGNAYGLAFGSGNPAGDTDWQNFRNAIYDPTTRNLIYFGHGAATGLGFNTTTTNRFISATEVGNALHTIPDGQTNRHAFRFVFLDGCSTALGDMPKAFGVLKKENVPGGDYADSGRRFSTFVGWPEDKYIGILNGAYANYDHINLINHIQTEMILNSKGIEDAIVAACAYADTHNSFKPSNFKVYGYWNMTLGFANY